MKKIFLCDKLVRDRVQALNQEHNIEGVYRVLALAERSTYAKKKILEEAQEALEDLTHHNTLHALSELSDVVQAAQALLCLNHQEQFNFFSSSILTNFLEQKHPHETELNIAQHLVHQAHILQQSSTLERDLMNICFTTIRLVQALGYTIQDLEKEFTRKQQEKGTFHTWTCLSQITLPQEHPKFLSYTQRYPTLDTV
ncbi:hypothetical protein [Holospora curviuscula]|uniref:Uncharacterized protein n=1 Tax=Holospora curviuscula TaxID=1082868 RepID=A0A2S5R9F2_9PROT|nr:hypothetical protein [Holospora curviuscula]PPE03930.1 hypothetical protein HCUR_00711 [Holospora curviuscula]